MKQNIFIKTPLSEIKKKLGTHKYEIIDISTEWCGPCRLLKKDLKSILKNNFLDKDLVIYEVDGDECTEAENNGYTGFNPYTEFDVIGFPTLILYKDGKPIETHPDPTDLFSRGFNQITEETDPKELEGAEIIEVEDGDGNPVKLFRKKKIECAIVGYDGKAYMIKILKKYLSD